MLRILGLLFLFVGPYSFASDKYSSPSDEQLIHAKDKATDVFSEVDETMTNEKFINQLLEHKKKVKRVGENPSNNFYDLSQIEVNGDNSQALAHAYASGEELNKEMSEPWTNSPLILVSLSMPKKVLQELMKEALKIGAHIVIRGAKENNIFKTLTEIKAITEGVSTNGIIIDPTLFSRFKVTVAPTFILPISAIKSCDDSGCPVPEHVKAAGSITLRYFLEKASRVGNEKQKITAESWLNKYKNGVLNEGA